MGRKFLLAAAFALAALAISAPAEAQYYGRPGYGAPPPQAYIDPDRAARNYRKLSRKQAEYYSKYGYPQQQPRRYVQPAPRYAPRYRPEPYYVEPAPRYIQPGPGYYRY